MSQLHATAPFEDIGSAAFQQRISTAVNFTLLDVRTREEFEEGHIPGAVNLDLLDGSLEEELASLDKEKTYFVYCRSGGRSSHACLIMSNEGFKVVNLAGGFMYWDGDVA